MMVLQFLFFFQSRFSKAVHNFFAEVQNQDGSPGTATPFLNAYKSSILKSISKYCLPQNIATNCGKPTVKIHRDFKLII